MPRILKTYLWSFAATLLLGSGLWSGGQSFVFAQGGGLAPTPPMGWNSYDAYCGDVNEQEVKANADYLAAAHGSIRLEVRRYRLLLVLLAHQHGPESGELALQP